MLDFKKIADILAPLPGKTALLIKDKTGVLYANPLAGEYDQAPATTRPTRRT
ncbi:hypothetical protein ACXO19_07810 [Lactobacillus delbrueckii subsp. bulgaricus]